jgi:hypothetical protein
MMILMIMIIMVMNTERSLNNSSLPTETKSGNELCQN